jgi:hypothetical protein
MTILFISGTVEIIKSNEPWTNLDGETFNVISDRKEVLSVATFNQNPSLFISLNTWTPNEIEHLGGEIIYKKYVEDYSFENIFFMERYIKLVPLICDDVTNDSKYIQSFNEWIAKINLVASKTTEIMNLVDVVNSYNNLIRGVQ